MNRITYKGPKARTRLPDLLEGFLYGIGEVCHNLFGAEGEDAVYLTVGRFYLHYLEQRLNIPIDGTTPWDRYCQLIEIFTRHGFYGYAELEKIGDNRYWMLETDQYAGRIWQDQKSWERGTAPCPLWSLIIAALYDIGHRIVLDAVTFNEAANGFESLFHFEKIHRPELNLLDMTRKRLIRSMISSCCRCRRVKDESGAWVSPGDFLAEADAAEHGAVYCPDCFFKAKARISTGVSRNR